LKTAGRQAAALLAQQRASSALVEARQFDAFNRLSAYVIHDLKNILAQQSLMIANARKHRDNPAFIDDMISTVENSVERMQRLMDQMRSGLRSADASTVSLARLLETVVAQRSATQPLPQLSAQGDCRVIADRHRLTTVFDHLIQNAQEATDDHGSITLGLESTGDFAQVLIGDTGAGMSEAFIRERLFKPFESTKGLTGMGIGAFESREYVRQIGGSISVESTPGVGTTFTVMLPLVEDLNDDPPQAPKGVAN
ncbi:MAG: putative PEP-CTERM system histidine kinase, partial [Halieaceae bacterium]